MCAEKISTATFNKNDDNQLSTSHFNQAFLLKGKTVVESLERWCLRNNKCLNGHTPMLSVVYFDTGDDAQEYLQIKAEVASKAGVDYTTHRLPPFASMNEVLGKINELNEDHGTHGILVQRPIPTHLCQHEVMYSIKRTKHVEEYTESKPSNIAVEGVVRLLAAYHKAWMLDLNVIILGGTNIITPGFKAELKRYHQRVETFSKWEEIRINRKHNTVLISELNKGGIIKPNMLSPRVKLVIDLGFDVISKMGDVDQMVQIRDLIIVPTPGGVLPIILWLMMERTIRGSKVSFSSAPKDTWLVSSIAQVPLRSRTMSLLLSK
ncbi:Aminoacid dehydrogenase-like protein [Colletotrichum falcatum]|nr:Aminoacid dehydrogenase-like protein [Colletotrichum falcatum]